MFALDGWDIKGFPEDDKPTEDKDQAATVWLEADEAAAAACCAGWLAEKVPHHQVRRAWRKEGKPAASGGEQRAFDTEHGRVDVGRKRLFRRSPAW
ncbi:hypothetical protein [Mesorhizobium sp. M0496]|uniref:hypothetical protein n=1 Tax=Mesorhizobium sp. M0496 TaxID=2956952 RepID=UPI00333985B4